MAGADARGDSSAVAAVEGHQPREVVLENLPLT